MLTGSEVYARYGSAIAALGDLDMDGYNGREEDTQMSSGLSIQVRLVCGSLLVFKENLTPEQATGRNLE